MKGRPINWQPAHEAFLTRHARTPRRKLHALFCQEFGRTDISRDAIKAKCTRMGLKTGRTGYYPAGHVPANKDKRGGPSLGRMAETQFKKGHAPANTVPLGTERICSKDGYIRIKVASPDPYTPAKTRFVHKHRYVYEQTHGPIPKHHVIRFRDGDKLNCAPENLICVSRGVNARLNVKRYNDAPAELKPTLLALAQLDDRIGDIQPSAMQRLSAKPDWTPPSKVTPPAKTLEALIEDEDFAYPASKYIDRLDARIAAAWADKLWRVSLYGSIPEGFTPNPVHIDWARLKGRPDLRNRIRFLLKTETGDLS